MIKIIFLDVDGTLTNGAIYIGENGEMMKAFNVLDGLGLKLLMTNNIIPVIITGRTSKIVSYRCQELGINEVYQNISNKLEKIKEILDKYNLTFADAGYIGDDINDLDAMLKCNFKACPKNAVKEVKKICDFISNYNGGEGAVREIIDYILGNGNR